MQTQQTPTEYISIKQAMDEGYGSRTTIMAWVRAGLVRSYRTDRYRMVSVADMKARIEARERAITEDELVDRASRTLVNIAPIISEEHRMELAKLLFSDEQKQQLESLLSA